MAVLRMSDGAVAVLQLGPLARERIALGYADPRDGTFCVNALTALLDPDAVEGIPAPPKVMLYAQPDAPGQLDLAALARWVASTPSGYPISPDNTFVPYSKRGIVEGVLATNERGDGTRLRRFLAVRRTGSVEYGPDCVRSVSSFRAWVWAIHLKLVVLQFWQLLFFIDALAGEFGVRGPWTIWCSGRNVQLVVLLGFGNRWAEPFRDAVDISYPLEENFQIEQQYAGGGDAHARTVREFATRFDFVFGSTKARAYDYPGDDTSPLTFGRLNYT